MTGIELRNARGAAGMTLRQLGERVGLSAPFLSDVEHGRRSLSRESEIKVRAALGMKVREPDRPACVVCRTDLDVHTITVPTIHDRNGAIGPGYQPLQRGGERPDGYTCPACGLHYDHAPRRT